MGNRYWIIAMLAGLAVFFHTPAKGQPDYFEARQRVHVVEAGSSIEAGITNRELSRIKRRRVYFSYYYEAIHQIQGAYVGRLLHGPYLEFSYPGDRLRSKGEFKNGLKHGAWTCWYPNGMIQERERWHKGVQKGKVRYYTPDGKRLKIKAQKSGTNKSKKRVNNFFTKRKKPPRADSTNSKPKVSIYDQIRRSLKFPEKNATKKTK